MQQNELKVYIDSISKYEIISREEENELARFYSETKSQWAKDKLINSNLRFVVKMANKYSGYITPTFSILDLIQEGNRGLIRAVEKFDPDKGFKLVTYAAFWIRAKMNEAVLHRDGIISGHKTLERKVFFKSSKIKRILAEESEEMKQTLLEELREDIDISDEELELLKNEVYLTKVSMAAKLTDSSNSSIQDTLSDCTDIHEELEESEDEELKKQFIRDSMKFLSEREQQVIRERYLSGNNMPSFLSLSKKMNIGRERIKQIELTAISKMKEIARNGCTN